jgi:serine/threonine-protein kinase
MGTVWAAQDLETGDRVAIKMLHTEQSADAGARKRLLREARVSTTLQHPNALPVRDVIELEDAAPALVMELLVGETLAAHQRQRGALSLGEVARIYAPIVSAVRAAHALGIVHRDLKPENVFLAGRGAKPATTPVVMDFGIAKLAMRADAMTKLTATGALLGTPCYMSPEQVDGRGDGHGPSVDAWALGIMLYESLSGILPTSGEGVAKVLKAVMTRHFWPLGEVAPNVPADVAAMVDQMLLRPLDERLTQLDHVQSVLAQYASQEADASALTLDAPVVTPSLEVAATTPSALSGSAPTHAPRDTGPIPSDEPQLAAGLIIAERFCLVRELGRGGMGAVWLATHQQLGTRCAVKFLLEDRSRRDPQALSVARARFEREAKSIAQLKSPHIVRVLDYGLWLDLPYLAMEYLEGEDLATRLARETLDAEATVAIVSAIARGLTVAHEAGIVHRDLKPANVFLAREHGNEVVKILDFGIAKMASAELGASDMTRTGALLGTPSYMSPEQADGSRAVDPRADLWSLAVITYQCVTGKIPFKGTALGDLLMQIMVKPLPVPSADKPDIGTAFDAWWQRAAERDVERRFQSPEQLADALEATLLRGEAIAPPPVVDVEPRAKRLRAGLVVAAAITLGAVVVGELVLAKSRSNAAPVLSVDVASSSAQASAPPISSAPALKMRALTYDGHVEGVAFSPDGNAIAIMQASDIRIHHEDGAKDGVIPIENSGRTLAWFPDGQSIHSPPTRFGLDGTRTTLTALISFSIGGERRAEWDIPSAARIVNHATGVLERNIEHPEGQKQWLQYVEAAPKDSRVLLETMDKAVSPDGAIRRLWLVDADNKPHPLGPAEQQLIARWSPRGDAVYVLRGDTGKPMDLVKLPVDGSAPKVLHTALAPATEALRVAHLSVSPDGRRIAFVREHARRQIVLLSRRGDRFEPRALTDSESRLEALSVSPDGRMISYVELGLERGGSVHTLDLATGQRATVAPYEGVSGANTSWSPDGKRIALLTVAETGLKISLLPVNGGSSPREEVQCEALSNDSSTPMWLDDHTLVYTAEGNSSIRTCDLATHESREIYATKEGWAFVAGVSPDHKTLGLVINLRKDGQYQYLMRLADHHLERMPGTESTAVFGFDGNDRLLISPVDNKLGRLVSVATQGRVEPLGELPTEGPVDSLDHAEGGLVAVVDRTTRDAWVAEDFDPDVH